MVKPKAKQTLRFFRATPGVYCASCGRQIEWDALAQHPVPRFATGACCTKRCENWGITVKIPFEHMQCEVMPPKIRTLHDTAPAAVKGEAAPERQDEPTQPN